jgi:penicillin-binding protein 1A
LAPEVEEVGASYNHGFAVMSHAQRMRRRRRGSGGPRNKAFLALMVVGILVVLAGLAGIGYIVSIAASAPPLSSLKPRATGDNTRVFAADGRPLGFIQADDLHLPLHSSDIPQVVKDATVAIEDERFYKHKGVDYEGVVRAAIKNLTSRKTVQGGSTITMQLVRSLYISSERTYTRKIREAKLAEELEDEHSKEWILEKYLDSIPYGTVGGQSAIGIKAAAKIYFSKNLKDLTLRQAALLAGLPQAPSDYSPTRSRKAARTRRDEVLRKMAELKMITPAQADAAIAKPLGLKLSSYFSKRREEYFFDYVKDQLFREYGAQTVRAGGMKVYTTIDLEKQAEARDTISDHLAGIGPSSAIVTLNPRNGDIEAMASSGDYGQSNFNLAAQGHRRPGSTFKVMALMTALRRGVDPDATHYTSVSPTRVNDPIYGNFEIRTYGGVGAGNLSLRQATLKSDNSVYIQLAMDLGPDEVKKTARDMGITSTLKGYPAETLGGLENGVSPLEMATAYSTIASGGYRLRPTAIKKIKFPDGRVEEGDELPARFRVKRVRVFEDGVAAEGREILEQNIQGGTGTHAQIGCPAAGKTGTTDNNTDAWFVGFTPRYTTAVWVGYPKDDIQMNGLYFGRNVDGGTFPADIWGDYMKRIKGSYCGDFTPPKHPFVSSPFFGKYAKSGGKLIGAGDDETTDPTTTPDPNADDTNGTGGVTAPEGNDEGTPGQDNGNFDPDQYEATPQPPPDSQPPPDAGNGGGATAPPG